ncbi:MAG: phosphatidylglycerol lysyltransferase [Spirochaetota bacterium]|jgi:phosphoglucomutase|uniref:phosphatidylglycerol lysyltransferase n=1 Tax=Gracilinema caldarium TaxID=215591 RepID=UPI0016A39CE5|nr:phosphatidylglycerol lysyltransferase [Gracilinema caldarium]NLJ10916.1 phosphatidylglycerol lysyltransferase [Treponema sp.]
MAPIRHPDTGLLLGDPDFIPLQSISEQTIHGELEAALERLILSASGWRTVFAPSGNEEDNDSSISSAHYIIAATAGLVFSDYIKTKSGKKNPVLLVGQDSRPTGTAIADTIIKILLATGCEVRYAFIISAPEIMAYSRQAELIDGFVYISASHNPIGHNGIKFGLNDGGVLPASEAKLLIEAFQAAIRRKEHLSLLQNQLRSITSRQVAQVYENTRNIKREAYSAYLLFSHEVITGHQDREQQNRIYSYIEETTKQQGLGILIDFNGSARTTSIDRNFLETLGCTVETMNDKPRQIAHRIVPEGESLEPCRQKLEELHQKNPAFVLGYVPDCDGDRGNLVIWDESIQAGRSLEAQEVFALCCVAELAHMVFTGELRYDKKGNAIDKVAVAINDPTSMRIDRIAQAFDVSVFRAEVGEANVVGLARRLRQQGYKVRILGEGAAGGNITHPSSVRDPIDTIGAILKLLTIRSHHDTMGLFELWCELSGQAEAYRDDFTLSTIINTLPSFVTTSAYAPEAVLKIKTNDHALLKERFESVFHREWELRKKELASRYGIVEWEALAYNGMDERRNVQHFREAGRGGLKILFRNQQNLEIAYIWMRGSGTEPVFRVMADVAGKDNRMERDLLAWLRQMVETADT